MLVDVTVITLYGNDANLPYNATIKITCHKRLRFDDGYVSKTIRYTVVFETKFSSTASI